MDIYVGDPLLGEKIDTYRHTFFLHVTVYDSFARVNCHRQPTAKLSSDTLLNAATKQEEEEMIRMEHVWGTTWAL